MLRRSKPRRSAVSPQQSEQRFFTLHFVLFQAAAAMAGGFIGAYLLKCGFSLAAALVAYGGYLAVRSVFRFVALAAVRRVGYQRGLMLGTAVVGLQFIPLMWAQHLGCLLAWMGCVAMGEAFYWPVYHATMATQADEGNRGRQVAQRTTILTILTIVGPLVGAALLTRFGPVVSFGTATLLTTLSVLPLFALRRISLGAVPTWRETWQGADVIALAAFSADGWMSSGLLIAWPMVLFTSVGSHFATLGALNAAAGAVGAVASHFCGRGIDRGQRGSYLNTVCWLLFGSVLIRALASWSPLAASVANLSGAAVTAMYTPVLMSVIYDRAKRSGAIYRFHFIMEAGWDAGAVSGCLVAAGVAMVAPASLVVLPAMGAILVIHRCVREEGKRFFLKKEPKTFVSLAGVGP